MYRASNTFSVLQAIAATAGLAILLWSIGLPSLRIAEAANVTSYSDTLSTSEPLVASDHTIVFTTPTGVLNTETITIDFSAFTGTSSIVNTDVTVATTSALTVGASCGAVDVAQTWTGDTMVLTMCSTAGGQVAPNGTTTIQIGTGANQLVNGTAGSKEIPLTAGPSDSGETRVAIVPVVTVTASVDTVFDFTVTGVTAGDSVNGTTTGTTTTATLIAFGELDPGTATTAAQDLQVETNAKNGFTVTVTADGMLDSTNGADIDGFRNGSYETSPLAWEGPSPVVGSEETYGHWGITSDDIDYFSAQQTYVSASTTAVEIYTHGGPADGTTTGEGTTRVGYTVEISTLQEAAEDYQAILTYIATPVF